MFYYCESIQQYTMIVDEEFACIIKDKTQLLSKSLKLMWLYMTNGFMIRNHEHRELFMHMIIAQINAYEQLSHMLLSLSGCDEDVLDETFSHRLNYACIKEDSHGEPVEMYHDECGLLMHLRDEEQKIIKDYIDLIERSNHPDVQDLLHHCMEYHHQCFISIKYLLEKLNHPQKTKKFDEMDGNYFDPLVPYFINQ